jgi:serine/threonine-protein kinase
MMGIPRRITAALCVSLLAAAPVAAQGPTPTPQQKQAAGDLTKQAIAKSQSGDHEKAIELYLQAYEIVPLAILYTNVGAEYQKLKKPAEAWKYFCMYLEKDPKGPSSEFATTQAKAMQHEMGNHAVTDATVCEPPKPVEPTPPVETPVVETQPPPATTSQDKGKTLRIAGLVVGGAGVVSLGVGVFFGIKAKQISDDISDHPMNEMWPDDIQDLEARGEAHEKKQIIFMIAGGAAVATGVALYLIGRSRKSDEQQVTLVPTATPESAGLAITGGF